MQNSSSPKTSLIAYHLGRLVTYSLLGAGAGLLGTSLNEAGELFKIQQFSALLIGLWLIISGIKVLVSGSRPVGAASSNFFYRFVLATFQKFFKLTSTKSNSRSLAIGLLSAFLPCGWLYAYVAVAAVTASAIHGALVMAVFWLGTIPLLSLLSGTAYQILKRIGAKAPTITALIFIFIGMLALAGKIDLNFFHPPTSTTPSCH